MKKILTSIILLASFLCFSQSKENGVLFINTLLQEKNYEKSYDYFDETIKTQITQKILQETAQQLQTQLGQFKSIIETNNENQTYFYYSEFEKMKLDIKIAFNQKNKIIGFFFVPHKEFQNQNSLGTDLNITSNTIQLKGTILKPENNNLKKLVIFIHGSGPNDRNETLFENTPFKDIAENLYTKGITTYRFDKRTLTNPETFTDKSTIDDEITNDIINIIKYFKSNNQFSEYQITLIGHSLGANLLPRIANKTNQISKIILLAGNSRPLDKLIIEQLQYLNKLNPNQELTQAIKKTKNQVLLLNSKKFNLKTPKEKLPLNLSANYWKSILDYNPIQEIQKIQIPILILQGQNDYQVTMTDFELWKTNLKNNKKATLISYPKLNHLFMETQSPSNPKEYAIKATVDQKVTTDITNFINQNE